MIITYLLTAIFANVMVAVLKSFRYMNILSVVDKKISFFSSFIIVCVTFVMNYLIPMRVGSVIGNPIAAKLKEEISLKKSSIIFIFEQVFDASWQILVIILAFIFFSKKFSDVDFIYTLSILVTVFFIISYFIMKYQNFLTIVFKIYSFLPDKIKSFVVRTGLKRNDAVISFSSLKSLFVKKAFLSKYFSITLLLIFLNPFVIYFMFRAFYFQVTYLDSFLIYWISFIVGRLSWLPGGLGVRDVTFGGLLVSLLDMSAVVSVKLLIAYRLISFFPSIPVGVTALLYFGKGKLKNILEELK
jgi:uncharacterized protein (TIRG00374 family)